MAFLVEVETGNVCGASPDTTHSQMRFCDPVDWLGGRGSFLHAPVRRILRENGGMAPADLSQVKPLKEGRGGLQVPVIGNGNVRTYEEVRRNRALTCTDGGRNIAR